MSDLSKDETLFIIQKKTCEKPSLLMDNVKANIVSLVDELKEDFEIEEKMEFSKEHSID